MVVICYYSNALPSIAKSLEVSKERASEVKDIIQKSSSHTYLGFMLN